MSACGLFPGEIFADENGDYVGELDIGDGPGGPFGWVRCLAVAECDKGIFGLFRSFQTPPCNNCIGQPHSLGIHVGFGFGIQDLRTVADASGPTGLEAVDAMQCDLPGSEESFIGWAGAQVLDGSGQWQTGILDGDTGWHPKNGEKWVFQCWAKAIPDDDGVTVDGGTAKLSFSFALETATAAAPTALSDSLTLSGDWQFFQTIFNWSFGDIPSGTHPWVWPLIGFAGTELKNVVAYDVDWFGSLVHLHGYAPRGRVLIKCAHLYPLITPGGNWIDNFHGHG